MTNLIRIHVFVEGQTEETFIREVLDNYFLDHSIQLNPILIRTSSKGRGGATNYDKIKWQIDKKCKEDRQSFVTTMFDLFKLPNDFPGYSQLANISDPYKKIEYLENEWANAVKQVNFIPYISLHEFESLLFSDLESFKSWFGDVSMEKLSQERQEFESPEHVNNGPETAPSKRISRYCSGYDKPLHGSLIALTIGLDKIRIQCKHFDKWLKRLENLKMNN